MTEIYEKLKNSRDFYDIECFDVLESTNTTLKERAKKGEKDGKVIIALEQTGGRGKMNRSFFSPRGNGIYMSILLKPDLLLEEAVLITAIAAVSVAEAIEAVSGREAKIKWVNDVYSGGKKVCGILTEAGCNLQSGKTGYTIVGIGINLKAPKHGFPNDISHIAGAVFEDDECDADTKNTTIAKILESLYKYYKEMPQKRFFDEYKRRSLLLGKRIEILCGDVKKTATAIDIDDDCRLVVQYDDKRTEALLSGDVSIKL